MGWQFGASSGEALCRRRTIQIVTPLRSIHSKIAGYQDIGRQGSKTSSSDGEEGDTLEHLSVRNKLRLLKPMIKD